MLNSKTFRSRAIFYFGLFFVSTGCTSNKPDKVSLVFSDIKIEISYDHLPSYYNKTITGDTYIGYNHTTHALDFFDLRLGKPINTIPLDSDGPEKLNVSHIAADTAHIIIEGIGHVAVLDYNGNIIKRVWLNKSGFDNNQHSIRSGMTYGNNATFCYNTANRRVYYPIFELGKKTVIGVGYLDLTTGKFHYGQGLPIGTFKLNFGLLSNPNLHTTADESGVFLSNFYSNVIYQFDAEANFIKKIKLVSSVRSGMSKPFTSKNYISLEAHDHYVKNRRYIGLQIMGSSGLFVRFINSEDPMESLFDYSHQYLCVFDKDGNEIIATKMDESVKPFLMKWNQQLLLEKKVESEHYIAFQKISLPL